MDDIFARQAWAPQFREAVKEVMRQGSTYVTETEKKLVKTSETGDWNPHEHLVLYVENLRAIRVVLFSDECKTGEEMTDLFEKIVREEVSVGLVLMGPKIDRKNKPYLIILTTTWTYYAFRPDHIDGIKFLFKLLSRPKFKIYFSDMLREADCLYHQYGIDLKKAKATTRCASGTHVDIMQFMQQLPEFMTNKYPALAQQKSSEKQVMIETFENLVEIWLEVWKKHISFAPEQLVHLDIHPNKSLSLTAKNVIKKRACLVVALNHVLEYYSDIEYAYSSELAYNTLTICSDEIAHDIREEFLAEQDTSKQDNKTSDAIPLSQICYYANFNPGSSTDKYKLIPENIEWVFDDDE